MTVSDFCKLNNIIKSIRRLCDNEKEIMVNGIVANGFGFSHAGSGRIIRR